ncbi:hypothetical protein [Pusillimonas noertemannii]|uniref:Uncharacterized protein n=1 Tax=Pusillimonas noertemannii TaxID=305977 RepID=A0A2U1CRW0_9BURK|nr:hypothetical protein [Pusillimonas noertemannii]NYT67963.1 hypothetical protein [Pusillimonas noertemannii]PVY68637.1 hypothetical protein C7440_1048 [Pusillimonas noertemannii]TFL11895.1 hypothetical protein CSC72_01835 [Pusillimonas noertemannii]
MTADMIFCLSVCPEQCRVILDDEPHGDVLAVIEEKNWQAARRQALALKEMDPYFYRDGWGWMKRVESGML